MGYTRHFSRREIARMIPVLSSGALLLPLSGQRPDTQSPGVIRGKLVDDITGLPAAAKMRVTDVFSGEELFPDHAIKTMPKSGPLGARRYFYVRGSYEIAVPPGRYRIEVVRGICHDQVVQQAEVGAGMKQYTIFASRSCATCVRRAGIAAIRTPITTCRSMKTRMNGCARCLRPKRWT